VKGAEITLRIIVENPEPWCAAARWQLPVNSRGRALQGSAIEMAERKALVI
jgi:hypothetical protein